MHRSAQNPRAHEKRASRLYRREPVVTGETEKLYARLGELEQEVSNLRNGYQIVNKRYGKALSSLKELTMHAREAAIQASTAATNILLAARSAANAAREARINPCRSPRHMQPSPPMLQAKAASNSAATAAATVASIQAEQSALLSSAQATAAVKVAAEAAADAARIAAAASDSIKKAKL